MRIESWPWAFQRATNQGRVSNRTFRKTKFRDSFLSFLQKSGPKTIESLLIFEYFRNYFIRINFLRSYSTHSNCSSGYVFLYVGTNVTKINIKYKVPLYRINCLKVKEMLPISALNVLR